MVNTTGYFAIAYFLEAESYQYVSVTFVAHAFSGGPIGPYPLYADCGLDRVPALDLDAPRPRFRLSAPQETGTPAPADKRKRKVMRRRNSALIHFETSA
jgi:hypothetical protein